MKDQTKASFTAVELFAGIGGFRIACDRLRIRTVFANDICPKAAKVYSHQFGTILLADLKTVLDQVPEHDLLTAGMPCQPFSSAGKKRGVQDPRGTLFQLIVEILGQHQPKFFVIENVKRLLTMERGYHFATILDALSDLDYVIEWRLINAMRFGLAQNRQRVVIIGTRSSNPSSVGVKLASDEELCVLKPSQVRKTFDSPNWSDIASHAERFTPWGRCYHGRFMNASIESSKTPTPTVRLYDILEHDVDESFDFTDSTIERIDASTPVNEFVNGVEILFNQGGGARMGYTVFGTRGVAPTVTSTASRHYERYEVNGRYRRLTNVEYARLQGFHDDHCSVISTYDQYALYGNAFPPPLAEWVVGRLLTGKQLFEDDIQPRGQLELIPG